MENCFEILIFWVPLKLRTVCKFYYFPLIALPLPDTIMRTLLNITQPVIVLKIEFQKRGNSSGERTFCILKKKWLNPKGLYKEESVDFFGDCSNTPVSMAKSDVEYCRESILKTNFGNLGRWEVWCYDQKQRFNCWFVFCKSLSLGWFPQAETSNQYIGRI